MKSVYAKKTKVSPDRTKGEIEKVLRQYGCSGVMQGYDEKAAFVAFMHGKFQVRLMVTTEGLSDLQLRRRYRILLLSIKSKFEMVANEVKEFEEEFLSDIVMPNGQTVSQAALPSLRLALEDGRMPQKLLPI